MPTKAKKSLRKTSSRPLVGLIMGSQSDWETLQYTADVLSDFRIPFEPLIVSAHRTPQRLYQYATTAAAHGIQVIIAGAGGAAHLPGMVAALTHLPVFGVPIQSKTLDGLDSLLSIAQMPAGIPVGTLAIGKAGAINAALLSISVLALRDKELSQKIRHWRTAQTASIAKAPKKKHKRS